MASLLVPVLEGACKTVYEYQGRIATAALLVVNLTAVNVEERQIPFSTPAQSSCQRSLGKIIAVLPGFLLPAPHCCVETLFR